MAFFNVRDMLIFQDVAKNNTQGANRLVEILNMKITLKRDTQKVYRECWVCRELEPNRRDRLLAGG